MKKDFSKQIGESMKTWAEKQRDFMRAGGQTTRGHNVPQALRYIDHVKEEAQETFDAFDAGDWVKTADGLADLVVVAMGAMWSMGIDPEDLMLAVMSANERKIVDGMLYRREDGQIGKPPGFIGPERDIAELIRIAADESRGFQ